MLGRILKAVSQTPQIFDHDKMILCLAAVHASISNTSGLFWIKSVSKVLLIKYCLLVFTRKRFWQFLFDSPSFININLMLQIYRFKELRYTWECNNWYKLWKLTKLAIFLILQDIKLTCIWTFYYKKTPTRIFLKQIKHSMHENFSISFLNTKSFYHALTETGS